MERKGLCRYSVRWGKSAKKGISTQNVTQNTDANIPYFSWSVSGSPWSVLDVGTQPQWAVGESKSTHPSALSWDIDPALAQIERPSALWNWQSKTSGKKPNQLVCFVLKHWNYIFSWWVGGTDICGSLLVFAFSFWTLYLYLVDILCFAALRIRNLLGK